MITEEDFFTIANDRPEMLRAFSGTVNAIIEYRKEVAANPSGFWAKMRLKKKQLSVTFQVKRFADGFDFNGQHLSEEEGKLVEGWLIAAANFHMLPEAEQEATQLVRNADTPRKSPESKTE